MPVIGILPRGMKLEDWNENWGVVTVRWNAKSIIRAVREIAAPTTEEELQLDPKDATERTKIIDTLEANQWNRGGAAKTARCLSKHPSQKNGALRHLGTPVSRLALQAAS